MAIPFLNHLDLLDVSEIQNAILHKTTSALATDVEGKIIYDTGSDTIKYYNGSAWISLAGDTVRTVAVDTDGDGTPDNTLEAGEDLVLKKGTNVTLAEEGGVITISSTDTIDMGDGFIVSADTNTNATTITEGETLTIAGGTNITTETTADGTVTINSTATDVDVSNANLLTRLANLESANGSETDENIVIGASAGDTIVITGNLQVSGTTTTVNSTEVVVADNNIVLSKENTTAAVIDGAGITLEGGTGDDATFTYSTTGPKFELKLGDNYEDLQVDQLIAASLDISGDVDVDGTLEADAITVNGSTLNSVIDGRITAREYKANFPSSATSAGDAITITHSLGTRDVIVQFYALVADIDGDANTPDVEQYEEVKLANVRTDANTITVTPNTALAADALRVLIKEL